MAVTELTKVYEMDTLVEKMIRQGQESFYMFCRHMNPGFYKPHRWHLKKLCNNLQALYEGNLINEDTGKPYKKIAISMPPGHGKSYTASLFSMWCFGQDRNNQIITSSYNEKMALRFGKTVRDGIMADKGEPDEFIFNDFFPDIRVQQGNASQVNWTLEGRYFSYLATSFHASLTGMRANIGIIDDPIKNAEEAFNETVLEDKWLWYTDTYLSRMLEGAIQIVIATRWSTKDLIGRLIDNEPDEWYIIELPALLDEKHEQMLASDLISYETYVDRRKLTSPEIFSANYDQKPVDIKGKLYKSFKTYNEIPVKKFKRIINYTDTADEGKDFHCSIVAGEYNGELYILDVIYTKDPMEETEPLHAKQLYDHEVNISWIESNAGGRGYARTIERLLWETYKTRRTHVKWFHQSKNKMARIMSHSTYVMNHIYFPANWKDRWPKFHAELNNFQKEGKNAHDDGADTVTGLAEVMTESNSALISSSSAW